MGDPQRAIRNLTLIRDQGVRLTIDDFGTGYSSLAYLKKLPVAGMKIDKSFVQNMESDQDNAVIVRSIVDLGHNLGINVVAEGVETHQAAEMLQAYQCDEAQGYYYSPPVPGHKIADICSDLGDVTVERKAINRNSPKLNLDDLSELDRASRIVKSQSRFANDATSRSLDESLDFAFKHR